MDVGSLLTICREHQYPYRISGQNPQLLLVGGGREEHFLTGQEQMIKAISPRMILHHLADSSYEQSEHVLSWSDRYRTTVKSCTMPLQSEQADLTQNFLTSQLHPIISELGTAGGRTLFSDILRPIQESYMFKHIQTNLSQTPLMVVSMPAHIMPYSTLFGHLRVRNINYMVIAQSPEVMKSLQDYATFFNTP